MSKTDENLAEAFSGESQANRKYFAFAIKATQEGLPEIAQLFMEAAGAETVHALNHLKVMGGVKSTKGTSGRLQKERTTRLRRCIRNS